MYWQVTGISNDDLASGDLTGSGTITDGKLDVQHSLVVDSDSGESFQMSVYSDSGRSQQIGTTATFNIEEDNIIPDGVILGNSFYAIVDGPTWTDASTNAKSIGGTLIIIEDADENNFITEYLGDQNIYNSAFIGFQGGKWVNGDPLSYDNFHPDIQANPDWYFSRYPYAEIWAPSAENIKQPWQVDIKPGVWNTAQNNQDGRDQKGIAEIPLSLSITQSASPKEGAGVFTTSINLFAGSASSGNLANGSKIYWKVTGIANEDLASGDLTGTGTITDGKLDVQHSLVVDSDFGESFKISVYLTPDDLSKSEPHIRSKFRN